MKVDSATWVGQTIAGRYEVASKLGEGGMGLVYRAVDSKDRNQQVVIKAPLPSQLEQQGGAERFAREIRSQMKLPHEHIVSVLDVGEHDGIPFAVMPYLGGGSLKDALPVGPDGKRGPLAPVVLRAWLADVAAALDHVHEAGYMHRDVKPANILFDDQGQGYLSDFGVVKALAAAGSNKQSTQALTGTGLVLGTPEYMAPELIMGEACDGRVDQFALAVTVYEVLSGRVPVEGPNPGAVLVKLVSQPLIRLRDANQRVSAELADAVHRGMEKDPKARFASCTEFAHAVLAAIPAETAAASEQQAVPVAQLAGPVGGSVVVACPVCSARLKAPPSLAGKRVKCRACGTRIRVPGEEPLVLAAEPTVGGRTTTTGPSRPTVSGKRGTTQPFPVPDEPLVLTSLEPGGSYSRRQKSTGKSTGKLLAMCGGMLLIAGATIAIVIMNSGQKPASSVTEKPPITKAREEENKEGTAKGHLTPRLGSIADVTMYAGETKSVDVTIDRQGYRGEITLTPSGLPAGQLSASPVRMSLTQDRATLRITAADQASEGSHTVQLTASASMMKTDDSFEVRVQKPSLKLGVGTGSVRVKAGAGAVTLPIRLTRIGCNGRAVTLEVKGLPPELVSDLMKGSTLASGQDMRDVKFSAVAAAPGAAHPITVVASIPSLNVKVEEVVRVDIDPLRVRVKAPDTVTAWVGRAMAVPVTVERDGLVGAIQLQADKLPAGVTAATATIPNGQNVGQLLFVGTEEAKEGSAPVQVTALSGGKPIGSPAGISVTVKAREGLFRKFPGGSRLVALSPDGTRIGIVSEDGLGVAVYDANTGKKPFEDLPRKSSPIRYLELASDGRRLVTETEAEVVIWDGRREVKSLKGHKGPRFSSYGDSVLCFKDKNIVIYDVSNPNDPKQGDPLRQTFAAVEEGVLSPNRRLIATLQGANRLIRVLDASSGREVFTPKDRLGEGKKILFSPESKYLLAVEGDGNAHRVWDIGANAEKSVPPRRRSFQAAAFDKNERLITVGGGGSGKEVSVWDLGKQALASSFEIAGAMEVIVSPDGSRVAGVCSDGTIRVMEPATNKLLQILTGQPEPVRDLHFSANARRLAATGTAGKFVTVWSLEE